MSGCILDQKLLVYLNQVIHPVDNCSRYLYTKEKKHFIQKLENVPYRSSGCEEIMKIVGKEKERNYDFPSNDLNEII